MIGRLCAVIVERKKDITISAPTLMSTVSNIYGEEDIAEIGIRNFSFWNRKGEDSDDVSSLCGELKRRAPVKTI